MASKRVHYVDNEKFLKALQVYLPYIKPLRDKYKKEREALLKKGMKKKNLPKFKWPHTPEYEYIGECFLKIAERLSHSGSYIQYTFREDMVGDAIENAILYMDNFDAENLKNPFAYFTQLMARAFWRRISSEATQAYIKQKSSEQQADNFYSTQTVDKGAYKNAYATFIRDNKSDIIKDFEEKKKVKREKIEKNRKVKEDQINKFMVEVENTEEESIECL